MDRRTKFRWPQCVSARSWVRMQVGGLGDKVRARRKLHALMYKYVLVGPDSTQIPVGEALLTSLQLW